MDIIDINLLVYYSSNSDVTFYHMWEKSTWLSDINLDYSHLLMMKRFIYYRRQRSGRY